MHLCALMTGRFNIEAYDSGTHARAGTLTLAHGPVQTPMFMPVGTLGAVKGVSHKDLTEIIGAEIILANAYHLYLRPGMDILQSAGGIHRFCAWEKPVLTDSGGYQVYSLSPMRKIDRQGVHFRSHIDGSAHFFSPENVMDIERQIGADIIMAFDECTPWPCDYAYAERSMELTHHWLDRCIRQFNQTQPLYGYDQILAPIVQGSTYADLRRQSAEYIAKKQMPVNAIGGLSVGEPADEMYAMTEQVCAILPVDKPRYLMGVGTPANILQSIALGIDLFDCVMPTRNARHGLLYTWNGVINIKNEKWRADHSPVDPEGSVWSQTYSKAYLRHLIMHNEMLGAMIASVHNLAFYLALVREARKRILDGTFANWKDTVAARIQKRI